MNQEEHYIKALMQIILGAGLLSIYLIIEAPLKAISSYECTHWYNPSDEAFLHFLKWSCLLRALVLLLVAVGQIIKRLILQKQKNK